MRIVGICVLELAIHCACQLLEGAMYVKIEIENVSISYTDTSKVEATG